MEYIETLELVLGIKAKKTFLGMQPGDIKETISDTQLLEEITGYRPDMPILKIESLLNGTKKLL